MAIKTLSYRRYLELVREAETSHGDPTRIPGGISPGGAAAELGISRQAVHQAMRDGRLDAFHIPAPGNRPGYYLIPEAALEAFKRLRRGPRRSPGTRSLTA